jgi:CRP-like cAMP-binding protein
MKENDVIFSVESFLNQTPSYENIQTLEDSVLYYIEYTELQYLYNQCPEFNFIGRVVTEKYNFIMNHFPQIILRVPSKYIASYLGITEETLSRIRAFKMNN